MWASWNKMVEPLPPSLRGPLIKFLKRTDKLFGLVYNPLCRSRYRHESWQRETRKPSCLGILQPLYLNNELTRGRTLADLFVCLY